MSRSKSRRRNGNANPVGNANPIKQTQSPPASSPPSSRSTKSDQLNSNKKKARNNSNKPRKYYNSQNRSNQAKKAQSSEVFKKDGLNSELPQEGQSGLQSPLSSSPRVESLKRTAPGSKPHPYKAREKLDSGFESERKPTLPSRSAPSLPQRVIGLKNVPPASDRENRDSTDETTSSDEESEIEREEDPISPVSPRQRAVNLEHPTPISGHDSQQKACGVLLSSSMSEQQFIILSDSERNSMPPPPLPNRLLGRKRATPNSRLDSEQQTCETSVSLSRPQSQSDSESGSEQAFDLPSSALPTSLERAVGHREVTPVSHPDRGQQSHEATTWDIDDVLDFSSEGSASGRALVIPSPSPSPTTMRKRKRSNSHHGSRRKARPFSVPSAPDSLQDSELEPMMPLEFVRGLWRLCNEHITANRPRGIRKQPWRNTREERPPSLWPPRLTTPQINAAIGLETPSRAGSVHGSYRPTEVGSEIESVSESESDSDTESQASTVETEIQEFSHEQSSEPDQSLDMTLSELEATPEVEPSNPEGSSDPESEQIRTPTSIRDELPVRLIRQLNKRIEEAIKRDKEDNPNYWGGLWMGEYERGGEIKARVEVEYMQDLAKKKEIEERLRTEAEKRKRQRQERDRIRREEKERKEMEEKKMQKREEKEAQKKKEAQERQKQERSQRGAMGRKQPKVSSTLEDILKEKTARFKGRADIRGHQSNAEIEALQMAICDAREREEKEERRRKRGL